MRHIARFARLVPFLCLVASLPSAAQGSYFERHQALVVATQLKQPSWATPLVTISPRIEQGFRADFVRQSLPNRESSWNLGGAKGLQIIPFARMEIRFSPPPFLTHSNPRLEDGFGDTAMRAKYRFYGSPESRHNAIVTGELAATLPTGKAGNGSCCATVTPTLEFGKGAGRFAFTVASGASLPITGAATLGRQVLLNEATQFHAAPLVWLEAELNATLFHGGKNDGRQQTFLTPGLVVSRIPIRHATGGNRGLALTLGLGEQIALTHFHTYNHSPILSARLRF
ncbi:MAG: hypothetical protein M3O02_02735 [Acidobacteriota bacterium]|nr:hypothetical protein [Acidobacteriota bacterium]